MGDFSANFTRPDAGIRTVEGTVAGSRASQLENKRKRDQQAFEERKRQLTEDHHKNVDPLSMESKFAGGTTGQQDKSFQAQTVGLVTADEFRRLEQEKQNPTTATNTNQETAQQRLAREKALKKERKKKRKEKQKMLSTLSFAADDEVLLEEEESTSKKDPTVDTSFLPDKQRDQQATLERQKLQLEWKQKQEQIKQEKLGITYSYWDGSGHRRNVVVCKGDSIANFLEQVRQDLAKEFRELASISSDALLYVKEDLIIPQDLTFYDLIATKARGKSGPLFHFDVHDDVRVGPIDSRMEKDESHPGKVVERRWYERNKHIFPASRWEVYDPKKDYGQYTIGGGEVNKK